MLKCVQHGSTSTVRKIQLARCVGSKVMRDNTVDFGSEWLDGDCGLMLIVGFFSMQ